jgi:hypothetical protein
MSRNLHIYVQDANGQPLTGATIKVIRHEGAEVGEAFESTGHASFSIPGDRTRLEVSATLGVEQLKADLGAATDIYTFRFAFAQEQSLTSLAKSHIPAIVGGLLLATALALAFLYQDPSALQSQLIRSTAALGFGGLASILTGMIQAKVTLGKQLVVSATGAAAVYVISFFFIPA